MSHEYSTRIVYNVPLQMNNIRSSSSFPHLFPLDEEKKKKINVIHLQWYVVYINTYMVKPAVDM